ncbi:hypothetical protein Lal_00008253 [Lupinus albus]|uniref:Putative IQ motif, EF-hand binding, ALOG domain-containing protein n=1 Tax=Lupinus albus TaxID=3870 RepID=A0A6A4PP12_LUPAL|nr:putative IQ motif, EF-hand binding, ALOG domain-containing protein [Lupinus albus]KAF1868446.1 hypothetical protein Lal_00008253 [Lupinus albus]
MSASVAAAAAAISGYHNSSKRDHTEQLPLTPQRVQVSVLPVFSSYEKQKRDDWNSFQEYMKNHNPHLTLSQCNGAHVLEFLHYLDQFGKTKIHAQNCSYFGKLYQPGPCPCPLKESWNILNGVICRLRAAFEENFGFYKMNPFGVGSVTLYLREVRYVQAKARGYIVYEKNKRMK